MIESTSFQEEREFTIQEMNEALRQRAAKKKQLPIPSNRECAPEDTKISAPALRPCFEIHWGDSLRDHIETDDFEVLCLSAWNPYADVTLKDVTILNIEMRICGKPAPLLPNNQPSVMIIPSAMITFGDLPPKSGEEPIKVFRELVLYSKGAKPGEYQMHITCRHIIEFPVPGTDTFPLTLVES